MARILTALVLWLGLALPAAAACNGQDLSGTLTEAERARLDARLADIPYPQGNRWIARRGDEVLHLVGTVHLGDPRLDGPLERLKPVIAEAGAVLLEMTQAEQTQLESALASDPEMLLLPDATLPELLSEEDWDRLAEAMRARGMPPFIGARMRPWYVSMLLSVPACLQEALAERNGLDARIEELAETHGVPTRALEPFDAGFKLFSATPMKMQLAMIRASLAAPETNEDLFETLLSAYFAEDHARSQVVLEVLSPRLTPLTEAENESVFGMLDAVLLEARNRDWIPVLLDALAGTEAPVIAAFGAAHLSGETGVLRLLEQEGFTLERVAF